jgi:hypothetical protein
MASEWRSPERRTVTNDICLSVYSSLPGPCARSYTAREWFEQRRLALFERRQTALRVRASSPSDEEAVATRATTQSRRAGIIQIGWLDSPKGKRFPLFRRSGSPGRRGDGAHRRPKTKLLDAHDAEEPPTQAEAKGEKALAKRRSPAIMSYGKRPNAIERP